MESTVRGELDVLCGNMTKDQADKRSKSDGVQVDNYSSNFKSVINEPTNTSLKNLELKDNSPKEKNIKEEEASRQENADEFS